MLFEVVILILVLTDPKPFLGKLPNLGIDIKYREPRTNSPLLIWLCRQCGYRVLTFGSSEIATFSPIFQVY